MWQAPAPSPVSQQQPALHPTSAPAGSSAAVKPPSRPDQLGSSISSRSSGNPPVVYCQSCLGLLSAGPDFQDVKAIKPVLVDSGSQRCQAAVQWVGDPLRHRVDGAGDDGEPILTHSHSPRAVQEEISKHSTQRGAEVSSPGPQWLASASEPATLRMCAATCLLCSTSPHSAGIPAPHRSQVLGCSAKTRRLPHPAYHRH